MKSFNKLIYWYAVIALTVPNMALCFTEHLSAWAALANIVLPFGVYMALMSFCRKPGKMVWWLFPIIFFAAFQIVLLYLFGKGVIAVDMFLNLVTTNPGEAMELLDNLIPGVASVFILYLPCSSWAWCPYGARRHPCCPLPSESDMPCGLQPWPSWDASLLPRPVSPVPPTTHSSTTITPHTIACSTTSTPSTCSITSTLP